MIIIYLPTSWDIAGHDSITIAADKQHIKICKANFAISINNFGSYDIVRMRRSIVLQRIKVSTLLFIDSHRGVKIKWGA